MSYFCYQGNDSDCGFASLKMMMAYYSHNKSYLYIKKGSKKKDYSFLDLKNIAKQYEFNIDAYIVTDKNLNELETPFLAKINNCHLVMVYKVNKNSVVVYDPKLGKTKYTVEKFKSIWSGECLERCDNSIPKKMNIKKPILLPKKVHYIEVIFICIIGGVLLTGFYFIKEDSNFILVIGLLALFVIFELVENWYLIKNVKYFDNTYIPLYFFDEKDRDYSHYKEYVEFKQNYFKSNKSILAAFLVAIIVAVLLAINDPKNLLIFSIILLAKLLDKLLFKTKQQNLEAEISKLEISAFKQNELTIDKLLKANTQADSYGLFISARKTIFTFLIAVLSILMMVFNHLISTNYVLFHFGAYYVISSNFDLMLDYIFSYPKEQREHSRFIDQCNL